MSATRSPGGAAVATPQSSRPKNRPLWRAPCAAAVCAAALLGAPSARAADGDGRALAVCADPSNLPYSNSRQQGFENQIASLIADDLQATLHYTWNMQRRSFLRRTLQSGACDVVLGLPAGLQGVLQTRPYYSASYVFVTARDRGLDLQGLDDPRLRQLKIGLQAVGAEGANTPPAMALAKRGIVDHITGFAVWGEDADETPQAHIIDAVASGAIDVAIVWGPIAAYFAQAHGGRLKLAPVPADPQQPTLAFQYAMALGVRRDDPGLRDELQQVLDRRAPQIQAILRQYGLPLADGLPLAATGTHPTRFPGLAANTQGD